MRWGEPSNEGQRAEREAAAVAAEEVPEIVFDKGSPPERRLVLRDRWGGEVRMSTGAFMALAMEGISSRFAAMARVANADDGPEPE